MATYTVLVFSEIGLLKASVTGVSEAKLSALLTDDAPPVVVTPPVTTPPVVVAPTFVPAGSPRKLVGTKDNTSICDTTRGLIQVVGTSPDAFVDRGYNFDYTLLPGIDKPTGLLTSNYGNDALPGLTTPDGYFVRYFPDKRKYYQQKLNNEPDESLPSDTINKVDSMPTKPVPSENPTKPVITDASDQSGESSNGIKS